MDTPDIQIKKIVLNRMARCSVCHHTYVPDDIHVLSRKPEMWMMLVECAECRARNFVAAVLNDGDPAEAQRQLRRLSEDATRGSDGPDDPVLDAPTEAPPARPPVSAEDVLDVHEFLATFDGDFRRLFAGR